MKEMPFTEHLEELRRRIIRSLIYLIIGIIIGFFISPYILNYIKKPVKKIYFFSPPEAFLAKLKISILISFFLVFPLIIFEIWRFVEPGLYKEEKEKILPYIIFGVFLFYLGAFFSAFLAYPIGIKFLLSFGDSIIEPLIGIDNLFKIFFYLILSFSILFELPIFILILTKIGIVSPQTLQKRRREIIVAIFIITAIITPSVDAITLLLISIPLYLLFEISIIIAKKAK
ncbi:MAG: twin-arginine translocase subunit TatC [candidate division WOR-3 bacterium]